MSLLIDKLQQVIQREKISAHMPGHKYKPLHTLNWHTIDTTEIQGTDNLFVANGILKETMTYIANSYNAKATRLLVNGSTVGLLASIMGCTQRNDRILIVRDAHKAIYNACELKGLTYDTLMPQLSKSGISMGYCVDDIINYLDQNTKVKVVVMMSPTYYGYVTPLKKVAHYLEDRNGVLIVDEAHGAHLKYCINASNQALAMDAHIVVQSAHKTLPAMTQSALLHYNHNIKDVWINSVDHHLEMLQTSSPSYVLMSSIDNAVQTMDNNKKEHKQFETQLNTLINTHLSKWLLKERPQDPFKLWLETAPNGYSGYQFNDYLESKGIVSEMATDWGVLLYLSHMNTLDDIKSIISCIHQMPIKTPYAAISIFYDKKPQKINYKKPQKIMNLSLEDTLGYYIAEDVIPYPPGIRFMLKGEKINNNHMKVLKMLQKNKYKVIGVEDKTLNRLNVYQIER